MEDSKPTATDLLEVLNREPQEDLALPLKKVGLELVPAHEIPEALPANIQDIPIIRSVYQTLFKTLSGFPDALGLSANQIGIPAQVCLINTPQAFLCLVNAEYQGLGETFDSDEGCLSLPGETWTVPRYETIWLKSGYVFNLADNQLLRVEKYFQTDTVKLSGNLSIVVQHEIDHGLNRLISDWPNTRKV